jgi:hypothetical protein
MFFSLAWQISIARETFRAPAREHGEEGLTARLQED